MAFRTVFLQQRTDVSGELLSPLDGQRDREVEDDRDVRDPHVALSATEHSGIAQFTFPAGKPANIVVPISHTLADTEAAEVRVTGDRQIEGYVENHIFCGRKQTYKVYFTMTFDRPFSSFGTWSGKKYDGPGTITAGSHEAEQSSHDGWTGAYATWAPEAHDQTVTARIGISYVDPEGAENNLKTEVAGKSFAQIRAAAHAAWNRELSVVDVTGGSKARRTVFYTSLYHSLMMPTIYSDADGRYPGSDDKVRTAPAGRLIYANYSGWDIYRSEVPLLALVEPRRMEDMAQSIVLMYQQGGWIGRWPQTNRYTNVMVGSPLTVVVATAWLDGLHGFDMNTAWKGMLKDATEAPSAGKPYMGEEGYPVDQPSPLPTRRQGPLRVRVAVAGGCDCVCFALPACGGAGKDHRCEDAVRARSLLPQPVRPAG